MSHIEVINISLFWPKKLINKNFKPKTSGFPLFNFFKRQTRCLDKNLLFTYMFSINKISFKPQNKLMIIFILVSIMLLY